MLVESFKKSIAGNSAALYRQYRLSVGRLISAPFEKARYKSSGTKPLAQNRKLRVA